MALFDLNGQIALQFAISFIHSHTDGDGAAMQGAGRPIGSNLVQCLAKGHLDMWSQGSNYQPCD